MKTLYVASRRKLGSMVSVHVAPDFSKVNPLAFKVSKCTILIVGGGRAKSDKRLHDPFFRNSCRSSGSANGIALC
jgi:hypothetical protein